jgi:hypothetical protein
VFLLSYYNYSAFNRKLNGEILLECEICEFAGHIFPAPFFFLHHISELLQSLSSPQWHNETGYRFWNGLTDCEVVFLNNNASEKQRIDNNQIVKI